MKNKPKHLQDIVGRWSQITFSPGHVLQHTAQWQYNATSVLLLVQKQKRGKKKKLHELFEEKNLGLFLVQRQKVTEWQSCSRLCHLEINELPVRVSPVTIIMPA